MADEVGGNDIYDPAFVRDLFDRCSGKCIAFSYACSLGFTERWRRQCVELPDLPADRALQGYDLMAGTGEVWPHLLKVAPNIETITAIDISAGMHKRALERLHAHRSHRISFIEDDALNSTLADESADFVVATFGLKTFDAAQHKKLAALVARVLKPGGTFALIGASDPKGWPPAPALPVSPQKGAADDRTSFSQRCAGFFDDWAIQHPLRRCWTVH